MVTRKSGVIGLSECTTGVIKHCTLIFQGKEPLLEGCLENIKCYLHVIFVSVGDLLGSEHRMIRTESTNGPDRRCQGTALCVLQPQNHRVAGVGKDLEEHLVPTSLLWTLLSLHRAYLHTQ